MWEYKPEKPPFSHKLLWSWCFIAAIVTITKTEIGTRVVGYAGTDLTVCFREDCGRTLALRAGKFIKRSKLGEPFCGGLEGGNVERNAEKRSLRVP